MCCESNLGLTENYWLLTCRLQGNGCALTGSWGSWWTEGPWGVRCGVSRSDGVPNTVLPPLQRGPERDLASDKGLGDVLAWSGSVQEKSATWTALPCHSDEQTIPFQTDGSASIILLIPWTVKPPTLHKFLAAAAAAAAAKSLQSCPTLCDPRDGSSPGSPVPEILQARTLEWVAIAFSNAWKWKVKVKSQSCLTQWPHGLQPTRRLCPWEIPWRLAVYYLPSVIYHVMKLQLFDCF